MEAGKQEQGLARPDSELPGEPSFDGGFGECSGWMNCPDISRNAKPGSALAMTHWVNNAALSFVKKARAAGGLTAP